jgi:hypothetical protein
VLNKVHTFKKSQKIPLFKISFSLRNFLCKMMHLQTVQSTYGNKNKMEVDMCTVPVPYLNKKSIPGAMFSQLDESNGPSWAAGGGGVGGAKLYA